MNKLGVGLVLGAASIGLAATPALAGQPKTVNAVTHAADHADTTSVSGTCTTDSPNGPVWAYDNLSLRFNVVPESTPGNYSVTIYGNGSFAAFADPNTGDCANTRGSVDGWLNLEVSSPTAPDPAALPSQEPGDVSQGQMVSQLFDGNSTVIGGGHYSYTYNRIDGGKYTQVG